jgi:ADP-ribose pyrophosphatase YjhB (NUDIX family)
MAGAKVLVLRRGAEVRLPKGRLEAGETLEECALREVREESGLRAPRIVRLLGTVRSRFAHKGNRYERDETWFLMDLEGGSGEVDAPEAQFEPVWLPSSEADGALTLEAERVAIRWAIAARHHSGL